MLFDIKQWHPSFTEKHMKTFFWRSHQKRSLWSLWEKIWGQKLPKKFFGQVWGNSGKNPSHSQNLPAPTPVMKRHFRLHWPSFARSEGEMPRHASILRRPCAHYSTRTLFTRCCRLQCVTVMNIYYQRSPKTEQFMTAKIQSCANVWSNSSRSEGMRLGFRTPRFVCWLAKLHKNWECACMQHARKLSFFIMWLLYVQLLREEKIRACVSRHNQSAWNTN